ncbi:MAG: bifunctional diguanylate cyclase/phosphohydrolase [Pirellulaceae bacterium]
MLRLRLPAIARITIGLTSLLVSLLFLVALLGLFPDRREDMLRLRAGMCETAAIGFSLLADKKDSAAMQRYLESIADRNSEIVSIGVRQDDGSLLINVGDHDRRWDLTPQAVSDPTQVSVQLFANGKPWGTVEVCFVPLPGATIAGGLAQPGVVHGGVLTLLCLVAFYAYLRVVLKQLNPSKVVPRRVREALDTLAEGLLVLDRNERIVLANRAFVETTGMSLDTLTGLAISRLPLLQRSDETSPIPWTEAVSTGKSVVGHLFGMSCEGKEDVVFSVSASPVIDERGQRRGVLTSFENVTLLERTRCELSILVEHLRASSSVLKQKNRELEWLATRDSLTDLLTRRPFFACLDQEWKSATHHGHALSAIMVDVDCFKSINDRFGHAVGDQVLRRVAHCLREIAGETDVVCRYGGEEFMVLMPHTDLAAAAAGAERYRLAIERLNEDGVVVTASLGVSALSEHPKDPQELLDQADKCLYFAKRAGRNRVVRWDDVPRDLTSDEPAGGREDEHDDELHTSIPFHAVAALISALAYRDQTTAEHSRRVADLCVATGEGLLSFRNCYMLEMAALLHDIGKIGVPDHILLKPGPLTPDEWKVMRRHDTIGAEIVRAAFASPLLTKMVEHYQTHYGSPHLRSECLTESSIPLGARILAIADAYDSMVTDRVYRQARTSEEALAELKRCAGTQFDPELVERFIAVVRDHVSEADTLLSGVSREMALAVGLQIERFLAALDTQDHATLGAMCSRLRLTARRYGAAEIATKASELESILDMDVDADEHALLKTACELLDLCRSTQVAFLQKAEGSSDSASTESESNSQRRTAETMELDAPSV